MKENLYIGGSGDDDNNDMTKLDEELTLLPSQRLVTNLRNPKPLENMTND